MEQTRTYSLKSDFYILLLSAHIPIYIISLRLFLKSKIFKVLRLLLAHRKPAGTGHFTAVAMLKNSHR